MISLQRRPAESSKTPESPAAPPEPLRFRHAHRALPGGGRILVALSDGTPIGVVRYDVEGRENLPLLLQAFAAVVSERQAVAVPSAAEG